MIALLRGVVAGATAGEVVLDVGGVGYRVRVPAGTLIAARGQEQTLHTHLAVREDALDLYGFATTAARDLFEVLLTVTGVGPKLALAALGTLGADGLRAAVIGEDVDRAHGDPRRRAQGRPAHDPGAAEQAGQLRPTTSRRVAAARGAATPGARSARPSPHWATAPRRSRRALAALPADGQPEELIRAALRGLARIAVDGGRPHPRGAAR